MRMQWSDARVKASLAGRASAHGNEGHFRRCRSPLVVSCWCNSLERNRAAIRAHFSPAAADGLIHVASAHQSVSRRALNRQHDSIACLETHQIDD